jgi:hypothetical protein
MPAIPVNKVVGEKRTIRKNEAEEKERHSGSLTQKVVHGETPSV